MKSISIHRFFILDPIQHTISNPVPEGDSQ